MVTLKALKWTKQAGARLEVAWSYIQQSNGKEDQTTPPPTKSIQKQQNKNKKIQKKKHFFHFFLPNKTARPLLRSPFARRGQSSQGVDLGGHGGRHAESLGRSGGSGFRLGDEEMGRGEGWFYNECFKEVFEKDFN